MPVEYSDSDTLIRLGGLLIEEFFFDDLDFSVLPRWIVGVPVERDVSDCYASCSLRRDRA
jgi:hypothetical protein